MAKEYTLHLGDCLVNLKKLSDNSVDSIVTDPPYGISFMGKKWDIDVPTVDIWVECLRVLKPGGHLLAFAGTRTQHRMATRIEDAGFEIRDMIAWTYGTGFPKSRNISKDMDKMAVVSNEPISETAKRWDGWGTALKPSIEPITVARKPLNGTVTSNVLECGTGALNIDACRIEHVTVEGGSAAVNTHLRTHVNGGNGGHIIANEKKRRVVVPNKNGRWPTNLIHDGSDEVMTLFPVSTGTDSVSVARFFYCAKTSKTDRNEGLDAYEDKEWKNDGAAIPERANRPFNTSKNNHATVKPTDLMRYLVRLVTQPDGIVLDPFMGSGSTGKAAMYEGMNFIGMEMEPEFVEIAKGRIEFAKNDKGDAHKKNVAKKQQDVYKDENDITEFFE